MPDPAEADYQKSLQRLSASARSARESADRESLESLREAVSRISTATDRLVSLQSQMAAGRPAGATGAALGGIAAATGNPELAALAQAVAAVAPILDKLATLVPDLGAHLKILAGADLERAGQRVGSLAGEAAARGAPLPTETIRSLLETEALGERRRIKAQAEVDAEVTDLQFRRLLGFR